MNRLKIFGYFLICCLILSAEFGCGSNKNYVRRPVITEEHDNKNIAQPAFKRVSLFEDGVENIFGREIDEYANLSGHVRRISNNLKQARNLNALGEVPNSTWFTNRHGMNRMSIEELRTGPDRGAGPDMSEITITAAKAEGVSPGFKMKDSKGQTYFVKFDIKGFPRLNTAAEVISTKLVYACGYNTPENYIATLDPKQIRIAEGVTIRDKWGKDVPMTQEFVNSILAKVQANPDGTYRIVASKKIAGTVIGPFQYISHRKDDPNDRVSHNYRRELRGYYVVAAWLNNFDTKANNTLDVFVEEDGHSFVKHYIIDFATSLGSGGYGQAHPSRGKFGAFDLGHSFMKLITFGLYVEPWEKKPHTISPSVGYFDSDLFDPGDYAFIVPNPAFQKKTELDGFWGAKIVMSFTDEDIRAIVSTGMFGNQKDADYIAKTLIERRDKTGRYWYGKVNPLDNFRLVAGSENQKPVIAFEDLSVNAGFAELASTNYRYILKYRGEELTGYYFSPGRTELAFNSNMQRAASALFAKMQGNGYTDDDKILTFDIQTKRGGNPGWGKHVKVHFYYPWEAGDAPEIVAVEREN